MMVGLRTGAMGRSRAQVAAVLGLLSLAAVVGGCQAMRPRSGATALPAELRVGITPNYPPLALKEGGVIKGVEPELAELAGKQLGVKMTLVELPWEELIPALVNNKIDVIMSGMSITTARLEYVDFTVPYMTIGQMALVRKVELPRRREQDALDQPTSRVGVLQNTTGDYYARRNLKQATIMGFSTVEEGVAALRGDKIDFFLSDAPTIWALTSRNAVENQDLAGVYRPLTTEFLAWAVRQGDETLRRKLDMVLLKWEQTGQLNEILDDWIRTRRVTLQMK